MVWIGRDLKDHLVPNSLPWAGTPSTRPNCSESYWTSCGSHGPTSQACSGPSGWHPFPPVCWLHHTAWHHQQTCWGCTRSHCPRHGQRCQTAPVPILTPENTTCYCSPLGHWAIDHNSLRVTIQPIPYPLSGPSVKSMSLQFRDRSALQGSVKCFAQVQADDVSCCSVCSSLAYFLFFGAVKLILARIQFCCLHAVLRYVAAFTPSQLSSIFFFFVYFCFTSV